MDISGSEIKYQDQCIDLFLRQMNIYLFNCRHKLLLYSTKNLCGFCLAQTKLISAVVSDGTLFPPLRSLLTKTSPTLLVIEDEQSLSTLYCLKFSLVCLNFNIPPHFEPKIQVHKCFSLSPGTPLVQMSARLLSDATCSKVSDPSSIFSVVKW